MKGSRASLLPSAGAVALVLALAATSSAAGADATPKWWPWWRGPLGNNVSPYGDPPVHWTWPVPFPPIEERSPSVLYLGVGGGAGGAQAQCKNCVDVKDDPKKSAECATVCEGYETCKEHLGSGGIINGCVLGGKCASGGPFGSVGIVLF